MERVYIAGIDYGPYDGGFIPMGVYSTEEKAWAALGRGRVDTVLENKVLTVTLDEPAERLT